MVWRTLCHPNVLPLLGAMMFKNRFVMVSEWMVKGNIGQSVKADIDADLLGLVCFHSRSLSSLTPDDGMITLA